MGNTKSKYQQLITELKRFLEQGDKINLEDFENWRRKVSEELSGNYKIRFSKLEFYTVYEELEPTDDDLPF